MSENKPNQSKSYKYVRLSQDHKAHFIGVSR